MKRAYVQEFSSKVIYSDNTACFLEIAQSNDVLFQNFQNIKIVTFLSTKVIVLLIWIEVDLALLRSFKVIPGQVDSAEKNGFITIDLWKLHFTMFLKVYQKTIFVLIFDAYILNRLILGGLDVLLIWIHAFQLRKIFKISLMKFYFL